MTRNDRAKLGALLVLALACGCRSDHAKDNSPPNVLLISIDALRADRLGSYGYARSTSPYLDRLAANGLRFENAFANTHGTTPSHATILSGLFQENHRAGYAAATHGGPWTGIADQVSLVQERFSAAGYTTIGKTGGGNVGSKFGFGRGFDVYDDRGRRIPREVDRLLELVRRAPTGKPIFAFFHTYEVHSPYRAPPDILSLFWQGTETLDTSSENLVRLANAAWRLSEAQLAYVNASYDAGIRFTDGEVERLVRELEAIGFLNDAIVVVTSDHGEEFGEHGGLLHRGHLYDELLRVPLLVSGSGVPAKRVVADPVSTIDIVPTLLAFAGLEVPEDLPGRNLLAESAEPRPVFSQYGGQLYALRTLEWKLIETTRPASVALYDLRADPEERHDVAATEPAKRDELLAALRAWRARQEQVAAEPSPARLDTEESELLRALGYVQED